MSDRKREIREKLIKNDQKQTMKQLFYQKRISKAAGWVEIFISGLVLVAVMFFAAILVWHLANTILHGGGETEAFSEFLGSAFHIVIGIEFIKMLCKHNPATVVEVLMFAIARQMVVEHTTPAENLLCILGITILFAIRRFLFIEGDKEDRYQGNIAEYHHEEER